MDGPVRMVKKGEKEKGSWTHGVEDILLGFGFPLDDETLGRGFDPRRVRHAGPLEGETQGRGFDSRWVRQPARREERPKDAGSIPAGSVFGPLPAPEKKIR